MFRKAHFGKKTLKMTYFSANSKQQNHFRKIKKKEREKYNVTASGGARIT